MPVITYVDTSTLLKLLIDEEGSDRAERVWDAADALASVSLIIVEARAALAAATRGGRLTTRQHGQAKDELSALTGHLHLAVVTDDLIARAADLAEGRRAAGPRGCGHSRSGRSAMGTASSSPTMEMSMSASRPVVRWGLAFYVQGGEDIGSIKPDERCIVFGVGEARNPAQEPGTHMHPVARTVTSLDTATEERISALVKQAAGQQSP